MSFYTFTNKQNYLLKLWFVISRTSYVITPDLAPFRLPYWCTEQICDKLLKSEVCNFKIGMDRDWVEMGKAFIDGVLDGDGIGMRGNI